MPTFRSAERSPAKSRLGQVLIRLQRQGSPAHATDPETQQRFLSWQAQWRSRRKQVSQRLAWLDGELDRVSASRAVEGEAGWSCHTVRATGITSMGPF